MKNIFKFILRMAVTAGIVVGAIALVMHFTNKASENLAIVNLSQELNISKKLDDSHKNLQSIVNTNNQKPFTGNKVNEQVIGAVVLINDVLEDYYDHYITLTCFTNTQDANLKTAITKNINKLNEKIAVSTQKLAEVNSASDSNPTEKNSRIVSLFNVLCSQTEVLFETCSLLKQYVYTVNYQTDILINKTEAVLELAKDYSKVIFDTQISENVFAQKAITLVTDGDETGFVRVCQKALDISAEDASQDEINFVNNYTKINKIYLTEFYGYTTAQKNVYVNNINNFMGETPEGETPEQLQARTLQAQEQQTYLSYVLTYMAKSF